MMMARLKGKAWRIGARHAFPALARLGAKSVGLRGPELGAKGALDHIPMRSATLGAFRGRMSWQWRELILRRASQADYMNRLIRRWRRGGGDRLEMVP
jgi:hypothetical protein